MVVSRLGSPTNNLYRERQQFISDTIFNGQCETFLCILAWQQGWRFDYPDSGYSTHYNGNLIGL